MNGLNKAKIRRIEYSFQLINLRDKCSSNLKTKGEIGIKCKNTFQCHEKSSNSSYTLFLFFWFPTNLLSNNYRYRRNSNLIL